MKKTFVDLTYFSFPDASPDDIIAKCQSTIGFLEKLSHQFEVHFVVRSEKKFSTMNLNSIKVHFCKGKILKKWQIPFGFNNYIKSLQPDYILVHGFGFAHYLCFLKVLNRKTKIVLQCNGFAPKPKGLKKWIYQLSDNFIDGYLFTGIENSKDWYGSKIIQKEKIFEVMEGSTNFRFDNLSCRIEKSFIWVGRLDNNKDPMTILNAFDLFLIDNPTAKLTMVFHEGELKNEVKDRITNSKSLKIAVELLGFIEHQQLESIYNKHQFFILGSHYEGSGYALIEAMACGCVPVVTNIPPFEYMTNDGDCAFLFVPKNSEHLLQQLKLTQKCDYQLMQNKVLRQFHDKLSFDAIANNINSIFAQL